MGQRKGIVVEWGGKSYHFDDLGELLANIELERQGIKHDWGQMKNNPANEQAFTAIEHHAGLLAAMVDAALFCLAAEEQRAELAIASIDRLVGEL